MYFTYVNHLGEFLNFYGDSPYILIEHGFTNWQIAYSVTQNRTSGYKFEAKEIPFTIRIMPRRIKGKDRPQAFSELINRFAEVVSADMEQPGRLYAKSGEYLEGRIILSEKSEWNVDKSVTLRCSLLCDNPVWQYPNVNHCKYDSENSYKYLDYPYGYPHDYAASLKGYTTIKNASTEAADYILVIHGPCTSPVIALNGVKVGANVTLGSNDRLIINSADKTVLRQTANVSANEFNSRYKGETSMFTKLQPGPVSAIWSGGFEFDITILERRREPQWMI